MKTTQRRRPDRTGRPAWAQLAAALDGDLLMPDDQSYEAARYPAQPQLNNLRPAAIVAAATPGDVVAAVRFGREHDLRTVPRSGGHCFAGRSSTSAMSIDLSAMNRIVRSGRKVTVGAGAQLAAICQVLEPAGLTLPAGTWPTVGIAGSTLGGGAGLLGRSHGLTCDHLRAAEVVLADGTILWCDAERDPSLFWALRGAGGGQLGIVTTLVFDAVATPSRTFAFHLTWPFRYAAAAIAAWQAWAPQAPVTLTADLRLVAPADIRRSPQVHLFGLMLDADRAATSRQLAGIIAAIGAEPTWVVGDQHSYLSALGRLTGLGGDQRPETFSAHVTVIKSEFFRNPFPASAAAALAKQFATDRRPGFARDLSFSAWGGAYNRVPVSGTAFAHRQETFLLEHASYIGDSDDRGRTQEQAWRQTSWGTVHPWGSGGVYPNFPDPDLPDGPLAYHGPNLGRLREIKRQYDPDNWFTFHQALTPADPTGGVDPTSPPDPERAAPGRSNHPPRGVPS